MSEPTDPRALDETLEAELSALLDGELEPGRAAALRELVARSPEVAERLRALEAVGQALRAIPEPRVSSGVRARMRARIRAEDAAGVPRAETEPDPRRALPRRPGRASAPRRRRGLWGAVAAATAAAAALALWLAPRPELGGPPRGPSIAELSPEPTPVAPEEPAAPESTAVAEATPPEPASEPPDLEPELMVALADPEPPETLAPRELLPAPEPPSAKPRTAASELEASDDELLLAMEIPADDLPLVEALDLLLALEETEGRG